MKRYIAFTLFLSIIFLHIIPVQADEPSTSFQFEASVGENGLERDFSFTPFDSRLQIGIPAGRLKAPALIKLSEIHEETIPPAGFNPTPIMYQVDIPAAAFVAGRYYISIASSGSAAHKQIYFFDKNFAGNWRPLPTNENFAKGIISSHLTLPFVRLAVFESKTALAKGEASWYRYKNGMFAASPDFPKGTRLRVINKDNKKSVDVIVNDFGPDRSKHPNRVIDLDAAAFQRIANLGQGTIQVMVEVLNEDTTTAPTPQPSVNGEPVISATSALVFNSADKKVLWSKAPDSVIPLASLTKLVAIKVFLETKPDFNRVVAYSVKDEELNNKYVPASQSARLRLQDKETVRIKDLVYSSLIGSTNNTVESLVRVSGMSRAAFIARMNSKVKTLGATNTHFVEPTGLSTSNVTTANDYAIIARDAFLNPIIAEATTQSSYSFTSINKKIARSFKNTNLIAREQGSGLLGSKTGYLIEAGHCLVTKWPTDKNKNLIVVVFGEPSRQSSIDDTKKLLNFASKRL